MSPPASKQGAVESTFASSAFFHGMGDKEIRAMLDVANFVDYPARSWLYREGEPGRQFFFVNSGLVRLSQLTEEGEDVLIRFMKPGEVFGYFALALDGPNIASAQAIQPSRLAVWDREIALELLHSHPRAAFNLFNIVVRDVVYFHGRSRRLLTKEVGQRVEWALSELIGTVGVSTVGGVEISHGVGQRELAELAGTTIFTVSRELTRLQRRGILEKRRGRILVLQPEKLSDW
jgi:CRP/FNR family transcriptional regulator, nitrogen oxide reductase regulator